MNSGRTRKPGTMKAKGKRYGYAIRTMFHWNASVDNFALYSPIIFREAVDTGSMKRAEAYYAKERASARPVMMEFRYDHTVKLWRVVFRPRGDSVPLPRVSHFGDTEKLRELFRRFGSRQLAEDHSALEFAINIKRGAVELTLGELQLRKLRTPRRPTLNTEGRTYCG
jgi:hypothetical protein